MSVVSMSKQDFSRLEVLLRVQSGRLRIADACELTAMGRRQIFRLRQTCAVASPASLSSHKRGRPPRRATESANPRGAPTAPPSIANAR